MTFLDGISCTLIKTLFKAQRFNESDIINKVDTIERIDESDKFERIDQFEKFEELINLKMVFNLSDHIHYYHVPMLLCAHRCSSLRVEFLVTMKFIVITI